MVTIVMSEQRVYNERLQCRKRAAHRTAQESFIRANGLEHGETEKRLETAGLEFQLQDTLKKIADRNDTTPLDVVKTILMEKNTR